MAIPSQLSPGDSILLQDVMRLFKKYSYLEVGSYLGGSLHWHLTNPDCVRVISIDKRSTDPILDERDIDYAYSVTTQDMLDLLTQHNKPIQKLIIYDGTIAQVADEPVDLVFIDGEHTNMAVLSDATNALRFGPKLILFHDDWIVHQGLCSFRRFLDCQRPDYDLYKLSGCDITAVAFGDFRNTFATFAKNRTVPWDQFLDTANIKLKGTEC